MTKVFLGKEIQTENFTAALATIGNFDGVHLGHQALFATLRARARECNLPTAVVLFEPQPAEFFTAGNAAPRLSSLREKLAYIEQAQIDYVYCLRFDANLALTPAEVFVEQILFTQLKVQGLLVGEDFRFGQGRAGDFSLLMKLAEHHQRELISFGDFLFEASRISSTLVRQTLAKRQMQHAALLLGRPYSLSGRVIHGQKLGRAWGVPTANIAMSRRKLPCHGVFCVRVARANGEVFNGVASLGTRPAVGGSGVLLEVNLFDFTGDLYGERLEVSLLHYLRDESHFASVDALFQQIHQDIQEAREYFKTIPMDEPILLGFEEAGEA